MTGFYSGAFEATMAGSMSRILSVERIDPSEHASYGGKACGLARLIASGVAVPKAFAVAATTETTAQWSDDDRSALLESAGRLLEEGAVAVRSSAVGEDSADHSFAGQFETVLGVIDQRSLLAAVDRCILSGASERVLAYAGRRESFPVGVVVQSMVAAASAGVCFTIDPTGEDGAVLIEAVEGLGDALVSGRAEPEQWRVYRSGFGHLEIVRRSSVHGALNEEGVRAIASGAREIAEDHGHPLDLEWAIDHDGTLWWLQARPVTAAVAPPEWIIERSSPDADDGPVTVWSNFNVRETMPDPYRPLTWTTWREIVIPMLVEQVCGLPRSSAAFPQMNSIDLVHGYMYINLNAMISIPPVNVLMGRLLTVLDQRAGEAIQRLLDDGVLRPRRLALSRVHLLLSVAGANLRTVPRWVTSFFPRRCMEQLKSEARAVAGRTDPGDLSWSELLDEMRLWHAPECRALRNGLQMEAVTIFLFVGARGLFARHPRACEMLPMGIPGNPTTAISIGLEELAEAAGPIANDFLETSSSDELIDRLRSTEAGSGWLARFQEFLEEFGHRGPKEFDFAAPRWDEDPTMLLDIVRSRLRNPGSERTADRLHRLMGEREIAIRHAISDSPLWKRPLMRWVGDALVRHMPLREAPKHYGLFVFQRMRRVALEIGRRLVANGILHSTDDLFYLEWPEVVSLAGGTPAPEDLQERIDSRKRRFAQFLERRPPDFVRSDGVPVVEEEPAVEEGVLLGTGISGGTARGPVTILTRPDPTLCREGDVLVMEYADPGWTPLFPGASAVVMEVGGAMCHAAVVARELGIPAVFGARGAMKILTRGERVEVDGRTGRIVRESTYASSEVENQEPGATELLR
jgi:rifampicin phosphotransferase